jgi:hypothetical protein
MGETLVRSFDESASGWSNDGLQGRYVDAWREFGVPTEMRVHSNAGLHCIAVRRDSGWGHSYGAILTNRERAGGDLVNYFCKAAHDVNRFAADLDALAKAADEAAVSEKTGHGRFLLALLSHNVCSAARRACFGKSARSTPLVRMRELLLHAAGRMVKTRGSRWLKLNQGESTDLFLKLRKTFPVREKATI